MSYARWSNSCWYAFYNVNGKLSLWYDMEHTIDLEYEDCLTITAEEIVAVYKCTPKEAEEAMEYIKYFIEDYDPKDKEQYQQEVKALLSKWSNQDE